MSENIDEKLVAAISSRALFDLEESHKVFIDQGVEAYCRYQIQHEDSTLEPGVAFPLVQKLLSLHELSEQQQVEVVLISRNSADTGLRIFNSINDHGLDITRAAFSGGESPFRYIAPFSADLFLSADPLDVPSMAMQFCLLMTLNVSIRHRAWKLLWLLKRRLQ